MSAPPPSRQRGPASDPRHGRARAEVIAGRKGARPLQQIAMVAGVLVAVVVFFFIAGALLSDGPSEWRTIAYIVLGASAAGVAWLYVRRRRNRQGLDEALRSRRQSD